MSTPGGGGLRGRAGEGPLLGCTRWCRGTHHGGPIPLAKIHAKSGTCMQPECKYPREDWRDCPPPQFDVDTEAPTDGESVQSRCPSKGLGSKLNDLLEVPSALSKAPSSHSRFTPVKEAEALGQGRESARREPQWSSPLEPQTAPASSQPGGPVPTGMLPHTSTPRVFVGACSCRHGRGVSCTDMAASCNFPAGSLHAGCWE